MTRGSRWTRPPTCPRRWQAAAVVDGRLDGPDAASFFRHADGCGQCRSENAFLDELARLAASARAPERSELERRRSRHEVLRKADALITSSEPETRLGSGSLGAALTLACALLTVGAWQLRSPAGSDSARPRSAETALSSAPLGSAPLGSAPLGSAPLGSAASTVVESTVVESTVEGASDEATNASSGASASPNALPSAEAAGWNPTGVAFASDPQPDEASRAGEPAGASRRAAPRALAPRAGAARADGEPRPVQANVDDSRPSAGEPRGPSPAGSKLDDSRPADPGRSASHADEIAGEAELAGAGEPDEEAASRIYTDAVVAFSRGAYARAELVLARFEREFPDDDRVEDAAFLRAVCRRRLGDRAGATRAAADYLRRFPQGFRRREAEVIAVGLE